jgi:ribosomal protein L24
MSDVWGQADYALYWDEVEQKPKNVCLDTWEYHDRRDPETASTAEVDATDEVRAKYRQYLIDREVESRVNSAKAQALRPTKGSIVKVVSGKTAKGQQGKVVVVLQKPYGMGYRSVMENKLGVATSDEMVDYAHPNGKVYQNHKDMIWVWARNVEVVDPPEVNVDDIRAVVTAHYDEAVKPGSSFAYGVSRNNGY